MLAPEDELSQQKAATVATGAIPSASRSTSLLWAVGGGTAIRGFALDLAFALANQRHDALKRTRRRPAIPLGNLARGSAHAFAHLIVLDQ
jgi:hypothetical protein